MSFRYYSLIIPVWFLLFILVGGGAAFTAGCSKSQVNLSETEQQIQKVDAFLSALQEVYAKKDLVTLKTHFSPDFQVKHPELFNAIQRTFARTDELRMELTVDVIHKDGQKVKVLLHWDVNAMAAKSSLQQRGNTTLQLFEKETLQVVAFEGDNPFVLDGVLP
ncbi:MAG: hypothetical protein ACREIQ_01130 [Nitrospiria bacterium]